MPNQRAKDQVLLPFALKEEFKDELDTALAELKVQNRSQFIREAIIEKLQRMGVKLPPEIADMPMRYGKSDRYPEHQPNASVMNESSNSKVTEAKKKLEAQRDRLRDKHKS